MCVCGSGGVGGKQCKQGNQSPQKSIHARYLPEVGVGTFERSGALLRRTTGLDCTGEARSRSPPGCRRDTLGLVEVGLVGLELWVGLMLESSSATPL